MMLKCLASTLALLPARLTAEQSAADDLHFLVMGDWGGTDHKPWTHDRETDTAKAMDTASQQLGAKFSLALGDNFYYQGVSGDSDARFKDTFEDCFAGDNLQATAGHTFHVIAGNHDHLGDVQAQIDYTSKSDRWSFPSLYYSFSKTAPDGATVDFVMIDTVNLAGSSDVVHAELGEIVQTLNGDEMPGPLNESMAQSQMEWIDQTLAASTADYVIVAGHYPVYSAAEHGPTKQMSPSHFQCGGQPCLQRYKVSAYLCGHDHAEQFIDMGDGTQYHVIGAANLKGSWDHASLYTADQLKFKALTESGGFATVSVNKMGMQIKHFDGAGTLLYTAPSIPPRGSLPPSPTPAPTPAPSGSWECHTSRKGAIGSDKNLQYTGDSIESCKQACVDRSDCSAIYWHISDSHCHVLGGSFSHDDWSASLASDSSYESCFRTDGTLVV